jgi:two-component system OmpR family sensor kinase
VVAVALLAGAALVLADIASTLQLRSSLLGQVDRQLGQGAKVYSRPPPPGREPDLPGPRRSFNPGPDLRISLYTTQGTLDRTVGDTTGRGPELGSFEQLTRHAGGNPYTVNDRDGGAGWRVIVTNRTDTSALVVIAVSLRQLDGTTSTLLAIDTAVLALMLLLLGLVAAAVVRLGLKPLTAMQTTAEQIAGGTLSRRVDNADPHTEAGRLGIALNAMLARIEAALADRTGSEQRLRQFLADASHELRTPLTSIKGFAELYRRGGAPAGPALDEAMARIEAEANRMGLLVADLMLLARLDEERPLERHPVDLLALAADTVRDAHARVPGRFIALDFDDEAPTALGAGIIGPAIMGPATVTGDEPRLRQVATNLLTNALQYTPAEALITVRVGRSAQPDGPVTAMVGTGPAPGTPLAVLEVTDTGPGLAPDQAGRVFERLYRADASRHRASGGAGLGLAIVAAIVVAHGGRVELRTGPGRGAAFRVLLPAEAEPALALYE